MQLSISVYSIKIQKYILSTQAPTKTLIFNFLFCFCVFKNTTKPSSFQVLKNPNLFEFKYKVHLSCPNVACINTDIFQEQSTTVLFQ